MTRCDAAGRGRTLPLLLIAGAFAVVVSAALLAACGGSSGGGTPEPGATFTATASPSAWPTASPSPSTSPPASLTTLTLYFLRNGELGVAQRIRPSSSAPATAAVRTLLRGPSASEAAAGLSSDIPDGTRLNGLTLSGGTATVDLSSEFATPAANARAAARVAEVVYTVTHFTTVRRVEILVDGTPLTEIPSGGTEGSPDPLPIDAIQRRGAPWSSFEPPIFVESPGVGAHLNSPFELSGTASVFEGTFTARLADGSGRRIVSVTVQASRGAPGRGRFRTQIAYSSAAAHGTLIVYTQSTEDGSRQNVVRIPVTFSGQ